MSIDMYFRCTVSYDKFEHKICSIPPNHSNQLTLSSQLNYQHNHNAIDNPLPVNCNHLHLKRGSWVA